MVADSKDAVPMREVAAVLNIPGLGRNKLFEFLRDHEILDERNVPFRKYQDMELFRVIEESWLDRNGEPHINFKTLVHQKGILYIKKLIEGQHDD